MKKSVSGGDDKATIENLKAEVDKLKKKVSYYFMQGVDIQLKVYLYVKFKHISYPWLKPLDLYRLI